MLIASGQTQEYFVIERNVASLSFEEREFKGEVLWENWEIPESETKIFVEKRRVSLWEYGLFVIGFEGEIDEDTQESLEELCREEKCLFLQIETIDYFAASSLLEEGVPSHLLGQTQNWERLEIELNNKYYKKFIPPYTALINLTQSEEEILAAMKPKGRYNIKVARKKWVVVEQVDTHIGNITKFHKLMSETTARDSFAGNTIEYYKVFLESLENSQLFFAYHEQEIIAAGIFITQGEVMTYYYWASSNHKRNLMAPYLLQWTAIEHAIKRGCKIYDFLGVAWDDEKNSSLAGVTDFKMKLNPNKTLVSGSSLYIHKKLKYQVIKLLRKLKK